MGDAVYPRGLDGQRGVGMTCILLRTAPIWTHMALGGMQAMRVTSAKRDTDIGSSGDARIGSSVHHSRESLEHPP